MTAYAKLRTALAKRNEYRRVARELAALPRDRALRDLGIDPTQAKQIARAAVYR